MQRHFSFVAHLINAKMKTHNSSTLDRVFCHQEVFKEASESLINFDNPRIVGY